MENVGPSGTSLLRGQDACRGVLTTEWRRSHLDTKWVQRPPWRQPRGKWMVYLVDSHTNATSERWHLWEIDSRFAPGLPPGWFSMVVQRGGRRATTSLPLTARPNVPPGGGGRENRHSTSTMVPSGYTPRSTGFTARAHAGSLPPGSSRGAQQPGAHTPRRQAAAKMKRRWGILEESIWGLLPGVFP